MTKAGTRLNMPKRKVSVCSKCSCAIETMVAPGYKGAIYCDDCLVKVFDERPKNRTWTRNEEDKTSYNKWRGW